MRRTAVLVCFALLLIGNAPAGRLLASIDLRQAFRTRSPWRFTARQLPEVSGDEDGSGGQAPGKIILCISDNGEQSCRPSFDPPLQWSDGQFKGSDAARFLKAARVVHPRAQTPLLLLSYAGGYSGDGDQAVGTRMLAYDRGADRFIDAFDQVTSRNQNEEIRYLDRGMLAGAIVRRSRRVTRHSAIGSL